MCLPLSPECFTLMAVGDALTKRIGKIGEEFSILEYRGAKRQRLRLCLAKDEVIPPAMRSNLLSKFLPMVKSVPQCIKCLRNLLRAPRYVLEYQERVWQPIESQILLAFADQTPETLHFRLSWWKIITMIVIKERRTTPAVQRWKAYALKLRQHFFGSVDVIPNFAEEPPFPKGTWMTHTPPLSKADTAMLMTLFATRSLPAGDGEDIEEALMKHERIFGTPSEPLAEREILKISRYALNAGIEIRTCADAKGAWSKLSAHVSVSNTGCWETTRKDGGRRSIVIALAMAWLWEKAPRTEEVLLPTGDIARFTSGVERWKTLHRTVPVTGEFGEPNPQGGWWKEPLSGAEENILGYQVWTWAFQELVTSGYLNLQGYPTGKPMPVTRTAFGEPGAKVRVVTKALSAFVTYGQPVAHVMRELLEADPTLTAGLSAGNQAFEYVKRLDGHDLREETFLFSDFEEATDHISHQVGRLIMQESLRGMGITSDYVRGYFQLLCAPLIMDDDIYTQTGVPMGSPGSKIVLHLIGKTMSMMARGIESPRSLEKLQKDPFACAGDDVVDLVAQRTAKRYPRMARILRMLPNITKTGGYRYGGPYCETALRRGNFNYRVASADPDAAVVDSVRARLLSREQKSSKGDEDKNPVFGKAAQLFRELNWCPDYYPLFKERVAALFLRNFKRFLKEDFHIYVPTTLGGLGVFYRDRGRVYDILPPWYRQLLQKLLSDDVDLFNRSLRILRSWCSSKNYVRGIATEAETDFLYQEELFLLETYTRSQAVEILRKEGKTMSSPFPRQIDFQNFLREYGFRSLQEALLQSNRPFWIEPEHTSRGWPLRPFTERTRIQFEESLALPYSDEISRESFIALPEPYPKVTYFRESEAQLFTDTGWIPLNISGQAMGDRLRFGLPNARFLQSASMFPGTI